jgi:hypothetical protein
MSDGKAGSAATAESKSYFALRVAGRWRKQVLSVMEITVGRRSEVEE